MTGRIAVRDAARAGRTCRAAVVSALRIAMREEARPLRLSLSLVGDAEMRRLNRTFHGVDAATDVLAFPATGVVPETDEAFDGEIVVSIGTAKREARARRVPASWEASLYAVHGYLHLCGFDDHAARASRAMARRTASILERAGLDPDRLGVGGEGVAAPRAARRHVR
jgi:probable rRNA maturation factor